MRRLIYDLILHVDCINCKLLQKNVESVSVSTSLVALDHGVCLSELKIKFSIAFIFYFLDKTSNKFIFVATWI